MKIIVVILIFFLIFQVFYSYYWPLEWELPARNRNFSHVKVIFHILDHVRYTIYY